VQREQSAGGVARGEGEPHLVRAGCVEGDVRALRGLLCDVVDGAHWVRGVALLVLGLAVKVR
jgi:hypothetical protein